MRGRANNPKKFTGLLLCHPDPSSVVFSSSFSGGLMLLKLCLVFSGYSAG